MPVFLPLILIFLAWFTYERKKNNKRSDESSSQFWERERQANMTTRKSIDDVTFIELSTDYLPLADNPQIKELNDQYLSLSQSEISDLSEYTNTDLRLKYGVPNFNRLFEADQNFTVLINLLEEYTNVLTEQNRSKELYQLLKGEYTNNIRTSRLIEKLITLADELDDTEFLHKLLADSDNNEKVSPELRGRIRITLNNKLNS